ncbi:MAG: hypothetical protein NVS2B16_10700 [Chloroflexota bacterium]
MECFAHAGVNSDLSVLELSVGDDKLIEADAVETLGQAAQRSISLVPHLVHDGLDGFFEIVERLSSLKQDSAIAIGQVVVVNDA